MQEASQPPCQSKCWKLSCICVIGKPKRKDWWRYSALEELENEALLMPHQKWIIKVPHDARVHKKKESHLASAPSTMVRTIFEGFSAFSTFGANQAISLMKIASLHFAVQCEVMHVTIWETAVSWHVEEAIMKLRRIC